MNPNSINIVFFHSPCQDGLAAAWAGYTYSRQHNLTYEFVGIGNNNAAFPPTVDITGKNILFVDYAPNDLQLAELDAKAKDYFIIDHHKTNEQRFKDSPKAIFKMDKSGAGLTWEYFFPDMKVPMALQYIQDRDIWTWALAETKAFCEGFYFHSASTYSTQEAFDLFTDCYDNIDRIGEIIRLGTTLLKKKEKTVYDTCKHVTNKTYIWNGLKVCLVNCDHELGSDLASAILTKYDYDFVVCWRYNHTNEEYNMSLRSADRADVSEIAKSFGGGGHKNASGARTKIHPSLLFNSEAVDAIRPTY